MESSLDDDLLQVTSAPKSKKSSSKNRSDDEEGEISDNSDYESKNNRSSSKKSKKEEPKEESSDSEQEFNDGFDDELMGDDEDRKYLYSLNEIKREEILSERYVKRKEAKERHDLKKSLKRDRSSSKSDKSDSSRRQAKRVKSSSGSKASKALSDLKKKRAKAQSTSYESSESEEDDYNKDKDDDEDEYSEAEDFDSKDRKTRSRDRDRESSSKSSSRRSSKVESDDEGRASDDDDRKSPEKDTSVAITKEDMNKISLNRNFMERYCEEPFFDDLVTGFFVRIGIGTAADNAKPVYRAAVIKEVRETQKKFKIGNRTTSKMLVLKLANYEKSFSMEFVSNQIITETEYTKWLKEMEKANLPIMTQKEAGTKFQSLKIAQNYTYTDEVVQKMIEKKKANHESQRRLAVKRADLKTAQIVAKDMGNTEEYDRLQDEIEKLEKIIKTEKVYMTQNLNLKNSEKNFVKNFDMKIEKDFSKKEEFDPFQRRQTLPLKFEFAKSAKENGKDEEGQAGTTKQEKKDEIKLPKDLESKIEDPELLLKKAHDFDVTSVPSLIPRASTTIRRVDSQQDQQSTKKSTLSLDDYKRRRGIL